MKNQNDEDPTAGASAFLSGFPDADAQQELVREIRPMKQIRKIVLKAGVNLNFRRVALPHLVVCGETVEGIRRVKTTIFGDELVVELQGVAVQINSGHGSISIGSLAGSLFVDGHRIELPNSGGGRAEVYVGLSELPALKIMGSGDVTLSDLQQAGLEIQIQGSGDVEVSGRVEQLDVDIMGSGNVDARELVAMRGRLSIAGSGDISAHVEADVQARIAGSGDIVVRGSPTNRTKQVMGSGTIKFK